MKIMYVTSECAPFIKTGGLGDVAGSLPQALAAKGHDVRVFCPLYSAIDQSMREKFYYIKNAYVRLGWRNQYCGIFRYEADGVTYTPEMVLGPARKGIKLTYTTDTRPTESILRNAKDSDLFICEGMYGEDDKADKARGYKHMTFREAAVLARDAQVQEMWLTHYSPSLVRPDEFMDKVREIFPNAYPGKDGKSVELNFEEE